MEQVKVIIVCVCFKSNTWFNYFGEKYVLLNLILDSSLKQDKDFDDQQSKHRQNVIESTISNAGKVGFDDVIGLEEAKCSLQDAVIMPLIYPHLFSGEKIINNVI